MPWIPLYADEEDFRVVLDHLNQDEDVAFVLSDGLRCWRATHTIPQLDGIRRICLWHVPSGDLPLLHPHPSKTVDSIQDPWSGWTELRTGADSTCPYFGAGHPGVIWLNHRPKSLRVPDGIGLSSFEWIGNHYSVIGSPAPEVTERFWARLRRWVKKIGIMVPRSGAVDGTDAEIFTFPSALAAFRGGRCRDSNP
jgi:hypothetical protein